MNPIEQTEYIDGQELRFNIYGEEVVGKFISYDRYTQFFQITVITDPSDISEIGDLTYVHEDFLIK